VFHVIELSFKFYLNWFRGFGAPGGRKSPIDLRYCPYNSVWCATLWLHLFCAFVEFCIRINDLHNRI